MFLRHYIHYVLGVDEFGWRSQCPIADMAISSESNARRLSRIATHSARFHKRPRLHSRQQAVCLRTASLTCARRITSTARDMHFWFGPETHAFIYHGTRTGKIARGGQAPSARHNAGNSRRRLAQSLMTFGITIRTTSCGCVSCHAESLQCSMAPMGQDWFTLRNVLSSQRMPIHRTGREPNCYNGRSTIRHEFWKRC